MIFSVYTGMFFTAFAAATILPAQSEILLITLLHNPVYQPWALLAAASLGNVLGSIVNWAMGRSIETIGHKKWFPLKDDKLEKAQSWYRRYGRWSLLLSWAPFVGDAITVVAGVMKERFLPFVALVTIAKTGRYILLAYYLV